MKHQLLTQFLTLSILTGNCASAFEWLAGSYEPETIVTSHAAIDLDQQQIDYLLHYSRLDPAKALYKRGGFSQSSAKLKIQSDPPKEAIPRGTLVVGEGKDGHKIDGRLLHDLSYDAKQVLIEYEPSSVQAKYLECQVGGLVATNSQKKNGCFLDYGQIEVPESNYKFNYTYSSTYDNFNGQTIQKFSTHAKSEMHECKNCPYPDFKKFYDYYGFSDYADRWIAAAFDERATALDNGRANFHTLPAEARGVAVETAMKIMNIWMYIIRMMENALDECEKPCGDKNVCEDKHIHSSLTSWDQAVAFYAGSLEGEGVLMYSFANNMCVAFHACGNDGSKKVGSSYTNNQVVEEFKAGQKNIRQKQCELARANKERIVKLMTIPLIQGALYLAYIQDFQQEEIDQEEVLKNRARGATFAAAILPIVHECNENDASTIYNNLGLSSMNTVNDVDFLAVKGALENNYDCMGVTCKSVGGVWVKAGNGYAKYASPCGVMDDEEDTSASNISLYVVCSTLLLGFVMSLIMMFQRSRQQKAEKERETSAQDILEDVFEDEVVSVT